MISLRSHIGFNFFDITVYLFCIIFALICFYPLWFVFLGSLDPTESVVQSQKLYIIPNFVPSLRYYRAVIQGPMFLQSIWISVAKTFLGSFGSLIITSMFAYAVSKKHIKGMKLLNVYVLITYFFSGGLILFYILIINLRLYNTFWAMVIPGLMSAGNFVIMRNYFTYSVPTELEDAAVIDGANDITIFFRIIVPLSMPMFAAIFTFLAVGHWNDWTSYLYYCPSKPNLRPFVEVLRRMLLNPAEFIRSVSASGGFDVAILPPTALKMTTIIIAMVPIMALYPFLQKYFAKGMMIGAIKE